MRTRRSTCAQSRVGTMTPSAGSPIDHIGWRSTKPLGKTVAALKGKAVEVTIEPAERPGLAPGR